MLHGYKKKTCQGNGIRVNNVAFAAALTTCTTLLALTLKGAAMLELGLAFFDAAAPVPSHIHSMQRCQR